MIYFINIIIISLSLLSNEVHNAKCVACIDPIFIDFLSFNNDKNYPTVKYPSKDGLLPCEKATNPPVVNCQYACFKALLILPIDYKNGTFHHGYYYDCSSNVDWIAEKFDIEYKNMTKYDYMLRTFDDYSKLSMKFLPETSLSDLPRGYTFMRKELHLCMGMLAVAAAVIVTLLIVLWITTPPKICPIRRLLKHCGTFSMNNSED
ncbi:unnamed protein product [Caenorhabditis bovis]|uniref:Uncharacterized protein n=1 Tax=Caenorhabditis bovis TaxID=2654633 RepID=A0A8S1EM97_9PELO|nr:unnamed protein product [Caenorhabditis bovis]